MRGTGKLYLEISYLVDERRDPIASTYAAAKLLSHNYSVLKSWPLAITAYNHGLYGMKRAVARTGSRDIAVIIENHRSRSFKFASKNFYSCFLAACDVAEEPEKYFGKVEYHKPAKFNDIVLTHYVRPDVLAGYLDIDEKLLAELNPAIRPVVFQQRKLIPTGTRVHLPHSLAFEAIQTAFASIPDSLKLQSPPRPEYYRVSRGDNLYAIARRFGVSTRDLALENNISRINRIYAGQVLRIPGTKAATPPPVVSFVENKRPESGLVEQAAETKTKAKAREASQKPSPPAPAETLPDSLEEIVMVEAEAPSRVMDNSQWRYQSRFDAEVYSLDVEISPIGNSASIRVTIDETLGHYADWLSIPTWRIRQLNRMGNRSVIRTGQRLNIPGNEESISLFVRKRLEYHMALEEDFYAQYKVAELKEKVISRGETLWDIADEDGEIPLWLIKKYNKHADLSSLKVGMKLWIPVITEKTAEDFEAEKNYVPASGYPYYRESIRTPTKPLRRVP
jgi:membrane-bound lytic murein transglycosylase D